jgi:hypothetical protein
VRLQTVTLDPPRCRYEGSVSWGGVFSNTLGALALMCLDNVDLVIELNDSACSLRN